MLERLKNGRLKAPALIYVPPEDFKKERFTALKKFLEKHRESFKVIARSAHPAEEFYKGRLADKYGLEVMIPSAADMEVVHSVIYHELCSGIINSDSKQKYANIITHLVAEGAEGVILGCTEIGLLVKQEDSSVSPCLCER